MKEPGEISTTPLTPIEKIRAAFKNQDADGVYAALKETAAALGNGNPGIEFGQGATEAVIKQQIEQFLQSPINALDIVVPGGNIVFAINEQGELIPTFGHKSPPKLVKKWSELHSG